VGDPGRWLLQLSSHASPLAIFAVATLGFAAIYFGLGGLCAALTGKLLPRLGWGHAIDERPLHPGQLRGEVLRSLVSIAIFGAYGVLTLWLDAQGWVQLGWTLDGRRLAIDLGVMVAWNELHFYACHRLLHTRWLYKKVHLVHHRSVRPTPWATYSFHPLEAALLGSVMVTALLFWDLTIFGAILYPLVSLAMNVLGHSNWTLLEGRAIGRPLRASLRHSLHHRRVGGNFGFLVPWLDEALGSALPGAAQAGSAGAVAEDSLRH
jgi:sterol desaturase/sphingolipid hydroxylase (fatty acid hydroxylase superfamily)